MNGPPINGKAARTLDRSEAAEDRNAAPSLDDAEAERKHFAALVHRAASLGHTLRRAPGGYVLQRWTFSRHSSDLETITTLIGRMEKGR